MDKPSKVSNEAKANLFRQQIGLVDMVEEATRGNDIAWDSYVCSIAPEYSFGEQVEAKHSRNISLGFMKGFSDAVYSGVTPSAALLIRLAQYFDTYLNDGSTLSLDEAFRLQHKPRVGSPIKQEQWLQKKVIVVMGMWLQKKLAELKREPISIETAAGIVINKWDIKASNENLEKDESLKKDYILLGIEALQAKEYYPPTEQCINDLEKAFEDITSIYKSGAMPEPQSRLSRQLRDGLKNFLSSLIEQ